MVLSYKQRDRQTDGDQTYSVRLNLVHHIALVQVAAPLLLPWTRATNVINEYFVTQYCNSLCNSSIQYTYTYTHTT